MFTVCVGVLWGFAGVAAFFATGLVWIRFWIIMHAVEEVSTGFLGSMHVITTGWPSKAFKHKS